MNKKILFFINGPMPTESEKLEASKIEGRAVFRNACFAGEGNPETCDAIAGCAPENYKALFPFVGSGAVDSSDVDDVEKPKRGRKPKIEQEHVQTPLIPAETGWKANS